MVRMRVVPLPAKLIPEYISSQEIVARKFYASTSFHSPFDYVHFPQMLTFQQMCGAERSICRFWARAPAAGKSPSRDALSVNKLVRLSFTPPQSRPCTLLCWKPEWWVLSRKLTQQHLRRRPRRAAAARGWKTATWGQSGGHIDKQTHQYACWVSPGHIVIVSSNWGLST